jgi:hypothetical protein
MGGSTFRPAAAYLQTMLTVVLRIHPFTIEEGTPAWGRAGVMRTSADAELGGRKRPALRNPKQSITPTAG